MSSYFGIEIVPGYGAAKAAIVQMTKTHAVAWARHGVRVNAVAPGVVETGMTAPMLPFEQMTGPLLARTPLGRFAQPDEVSRAPLAPAIINRDKAIRRPRDCHTFLVVFLDSFICCGFRWCCI
jgi:NAD(P)-dependent dehydrogenase (short-subunit alcohol dehydrogenase family)